MKICSFLPSATEILFALGLGDSVCGVSFECDYPAEARSKPIVVFSQLPPSLPEKEIDRQVSAYSEQGLSLYRLDADKLREMQPDLIVTQDLCHVCAASPNDLGAVLSSFLHPPKVLSLTPYSVDDVLTDIQAVGDSCGRSAEARRLTSNIKRRITELKPNLPNPPRVLCLEWLEPPFVGGHWVPEMVAMAGGIDVLGKPGHPGVPVTWDAIIASDPDIILAMPCGYHREEVEHELAIVHFPDEWYSLRAVRHGQVFAMDASSHFSRPGPRILDGMVEMAKLFDRLSTERSRKALARVGSVAGTAQVRRVR